MRRTTNELLRDINIDHNIGLTRYANGLVQKTMAILNRADSDLFAKLVAAIENNSGPTLIDRLDSQLQGVRMLNDTLYKRVESGLSTDLRDLTESELGFHGEMLDTVPPVRVPLTALAPSEVYATVMARPFQGRLLTEWASSIAQDRMFRIRDAVRMGFVQGETVSAMVQRIRGTRANGYADGIIQIDRRSAEAIVRTAVSHTASVARQSLFEANAGLIKAIQWVSTLDGRTSPICRARDGLQYTCGAHKPIGHSTPWLGGPGQAHWNCRSTATPVLKSLSELGLSGDSFNPATRASMDGQVPSDTTYGEWFGRQSAVRQDNIVGSTRGELFRAGRVSFDQFTNDKGKWLTLEQLRASDKRAFAKAA